MSKGIKARKPKSMIYGFWTGDVLSVHRITGINSWVSAIIGIFLVIGACQALFFTFLDIVLEIIRYGPIMITEINTITLFTGIFLLIPGIFATVYGISNLNKSVVIFDSGLEFQDNRGIQNWDWRDIEYIYLAITNHYSNLIIPSTSYTIILEKRDGSRLKLDNKFERIENLGQLISRKVNPYLYENSLQKIRDGNNVKFGKITIGEKGLTMNKKFFAWQEIIFIEVKYGYTFIKKRGDWWFNQINYPVSSIPNIDALFTILRNVYKVKIAF